MKNNNKILKSLKTVASLASLSGILVGSSLLAGCSNGPVIDPAAAQTNVTKVTIVAPPKKVVPTTQQVRKSSSQVLVHNHARLFKTGETIRVVLPADQLFNLNSANFVNTSVPILENMAKFIETYKTVSVSVKAYTDDVGDPIIQTALTKLQAEKVSNALWTFGIDTRLISAQGLGEKNAVAKNSSQTGMAENRRVEIQFKFIPKHPVVS